MTVSRKVQDIDACDRLALEHVLGQALADDQQITISVQPSKVGLPFSGALPEWLNLYQGLSDAEIADLEEVILQRDRSASA